MGTYWFRIQHEHDGAAAKASTVEDGGQARFLIVFSLNNNRLPKNGHLPQYTDVWCPNSDLHGLLYVYESRFNPAACLSRPVVLQTSGEFIREWFSNKYSGIQTGKVSSQKQGM